MKYNNKLSLKDYFQIINDIVEEYFDSETFEYKPQFGEAYALCAYFNYCVEPEESDEIAHPIENVLDVEILYNNEDFVKHFEDETDAYRNRYRSTLTFGSAYNHAMDIIEFKKNDANAFATAIGATMRVILESFDNIIKEGDIEKLAEVAKQIKDGELSEEAIVRAYDNSQRFKDNTDSLNSTNASATLPPKK